MKFNLTEEQILFKDSVDKFLDKNFSIETRRNMVAAREAHSEEVWSGLASMGVLGVPLSEDSGGFGGAGAEAMLVMQSFGKHLLIEPYLSSVIMAGGLVDLCGSDFQKKVLIPEIVSGERTLAFAHDEELDDLGKKEIATTASQKGTNWILSGGKKLILGGVIADRFIISANTRASKEGSPQGVTLFIVEALDERIQGKAYPLIDGSRVLDIRFDDLEVGPESVLGTIDQAGSFIDCVQDRATACICAEALGILEVVHEMTMDYLRQRRQFGSALSQFQALQHRAVDMFVTLEETRSLVIYAAGKAWSDNAYDRARAVSAAKALVNRSSQFIARQAIQLHGGMGMTQELPLSDYVRRLLAIELTFGSEQEQTRRFSELKKETKDQKLFVSPKKAWKQI